MKFVQYGLAACLILLLCGPAFAQSTPPDSLRPAINAGEEVEQPEEQEQQEARNRFVLLPIIFSSPDTRYAFGVFPQYLFYVAPGSRPSRPSSTAASIASSPGCAGSGR